MLKPYTRQQIQTDKVLSIIGNTYCKNMLEQILTHEDILYSIIPNTKSNTPLKDIVNNTDSVVILINKILEPLILDTNDGYVLGTLKNELVGTEYFTVCSDTKYIIETNYKSVHDVYNRLYIKWYRNICRTRV